MVVAVNEDVGALPGWAERGGEPVLLERGEVAVGEDEVVYREVEEAGDLLEIVAVDAVFFQVLEESVEAVASGMARVVGLDTEDGTKCVWGRGKDPRSGEWCLKISCQTVSCG